MIGGGGAYTGVAGLARSAACAGTAKEAVTAAAASRNLFIFEVPPLLLPNSSLVLSRSPGA